MSETRLDWLKTIILSQNITAKQMPSTPVRPSPSLESPREVASGSDMSGFDSSDDEGELDLSPFQVSWLDLTTDMGHSQEEKLGISGLPGCKFKDTWRSLENDIKCLRTEEVQEMFTLCSKGELNKYRVPWLLNELSGADIIVHHYPFPDGTVPSMSSLIKMVDEIHVAVQNGKKPVVHCYGGLGRSCLVCAMLIMDESLDAEEAIKRIRELRGPGAIQSVKQYNFVCEFRQLYEDYKKEFDDEHRSISR